MPEGFTDLPPVFQVVTTIAVVLIGGAVAFYQFSAKWLGKWAPKPKPTTDAVVVSGAFADAKPVRDLAASVESLADLVRDLKEATRDQTSEQARTTQAVRSLSSDVSRVSDLLERRLPHAGPR